MVFLNLKGENRLKQHLLRLNAVLPFEIQSVLQELLAVVSCAVINTYLYLRQNPQSIQPTTWDGSDALENS